MSTKRPIFVSVGKEGKPANLEARLQQALLTAQLGSVQHSPGAPTSINNDVGLKGTFTSLQQAHHHHHHHQEQQQQQQWQQQQAARSGSAQTGAGAGAGAAAEADAEGEGRRDDERASLAAALHDLWLRLTGDATEETPAPAATPATAATTATPPPPRGAAAELASVDALSFVSSSSSSSYYGLQPPPPPAAPATTTTDEEEEDDDEDNGNCGDCGEEDECGGFFGADLFAEEGEEEEGGPGPPPEEADFFRGIQKLNDAFDDFERLLLLPPSPAAPAPAAPAAAPEECSLTASWLLDAPSGNEFRAVGPSWGAAGTATNTATAPYTATTTLAAGGGAAAPTAAAADACAASAGADAGAGKGAGAGAGGGEEVPLSGQYFFLQNLLGNLQSSLQITPQSTQGGGGGATWHAAGGPAVQHTPGQDNTTPDEARAARAAATCMLMTDSSPDGALPSSGPFPFPSASEQKPWEEEAARCSQLALGPVGMTAGEEGTAGRHPPSFTGAVGAGGAIADAAGTGGSFPPHSTGTTGRGASGSGSRRKRPAREVDATAAAAPCRHLSSSPASTSSDGTSSQTGPPPPPPLGSERSRVARVGSAQAGWQATAAAESAAAAAARAAGARSNVNPMHLLMAVAQAVVAGDAAAAERELSQLHDVASVYGDASQRVCAYFLEGLLARTSGGAARLQLGPEQQRQRQQQLQALDYQPPDCSRHLVQAFQALMVASPYLTFGQVSANCALLEAFAGSRKLHIVDFGIGHGLQWPPLMQALAARPGGPPSLRMTAIDLPNHGIRRAYCVLETGERLKGVARQCGLPFEYDALASRLEAVQPGQVDVRRKKEQGKEAERSEGGASQQHQQVEEDDEEEEEEEEVVAVNCSLRLHQLMDESVTPSNPRDAVLRTVRALAPAVVTLVGQATSSQSSPFFLPRFFEALFYYSALFDSLHAPGTAAAAPPPPDYVRERQVYEQQVLGRAIVNLVAAEGRERTERQESQVQEEARMRRAGFCPRPISDNVTGIVRALLQTYTEGYEMQMPSEGSVSLSWQQTPLLYMSSWSLSGPP